jgi:hypothetical protein
MSSWPSPGFCQDDSGVFGDQLRPIPSIPKLLQKHPQGVMRALDIGDQPALGSVDQDEVQHHPPAMIVEVHRNIGLVILLAQDRDRDRAELPAWALHQEIRGFGARRAPGLAQAGVEELPGGRASRGSPFDSSGVPSP